MKGVYPLKEIKSIHLIILYGYRYYLILRRQLKRLLHYEVSESSLSDQILKVAGDVSRYHAG